MTEENEKTTGPVVQRPIVLYPWLVALAALALYGLTLNHWVTLSSLPLAAQITGWNWHPAPLPWRPSTQYPLTYLLTFPLHLLPTGWRVMGLNALTAACAALTLAFLARSVRLLSHDRTKEQRLREGGEFGLLSVRAAFLPAAFAVLLLAAQLTFWENSISGTGEMIDVMVFAFLILCLLEFRISQSDRRLNLLAFVYGLGVANNWALIGFFPCFLLAVVWLKRMAFFNWRFPLRMAGWGVLGLLLYGLLPLLGAIARDAGFWDLLHQEVAEQHLYLARTPRYYAFIAGVPTLIPLLFAAINWPSTEGELNAGANNVTRVLFRVLHIVFLAVGVLMFFDVELSPSPRKMGMGVMAGSPGFLSFYYLAALSVGYFSGYVLLVFGKDVAYRWGQATGILRLLNGVVTGLLWVAAIGLPAILFYQNYQHIRDSKGLAVSQFANEMAKSLPPRPAVVLADDTTRLSLAMAASQRMGLPDQYTFIESRALVHREYLRYLADRYPAFRREIKDPDTLPGEFSSRQVGNLLAHLAQRQPVYYLHPSFGSYFEYVAMTPDRLGGDLHPNPTNALLETLVLKPPAIATNQAYWHQLEKGPLASLQMELARTNADALRIAIYYSESLDYWGVELQKAATLPDLPPPLKKGELLKDAGDQFAEALRLNPDNLIAQVNLQFNQDLRSVKHTGARISSSDVAGQINSRWELACNLFGPVDVPDLDIQVGQSFANAHDYMQAAHLFQRCLELAPKEYLAELDLAKTYIDLGLVDAGLSLIRDIHEHSTGNPLELVRVEALALSKKHDFLQADKLLAEARARNPKDEFFCGVTAEFYERIGYTLLYESRGDAAKEKEAAKWFKKSAEAYEAQLQLLNGPSKVTANALEIPRVKLRKAEMQMMIKDYDAAIITLTAFLAEDPDSPIPLLDRAMSELQASPSRLDPARKDYLAYVELENKAKEPPDPVAYFGLAQVAQKQNDKPAELQYVKLYLQYAPTNTLEFSNLTQRLHQLEGH